MFKTKNKNFKINCSTMPFKENNSDSIKNILEWMIRFFFLNCTCSRKTKKTSYILLIFLTAYSKTYFTNFFLFTQICFFMINLCKFRQFCMTWKKNQEPNSFLLCIWKKHYEYFILDKKILFKETYIYDPPYMKSISWKEKYSQ